MSAGPSGDDRRIAIAISAADLSSFGKVLHTLRSLQTRQQGHPSAADGVRIARAVEVMAALPSVDPDEQFALSVRFDSGDESRIHSIEFDGEVLRCSVTHTSYEPGAGSDHFSNDVFKVTTSSRGSCGDWELCEFAEEFARRLRDPGWTFQALIGEETFDDESEDTDHEYPTHPESPWDDGAVLLGFDPADALLIENIDTALTELLGDDIAGPAQVQRIALLMHALRRLPYSTPSVGITIRLAAGDSSGSAFSEIICDDDRFAVRQGLGGDTQTLFEVCGSARTDTDALSVAELGSCLIRTVREGGFRIEFDEWRPHELLDPDLDDINPWLHAFPD